MTFFELTIYSGKVHWEQYSLFQECVDQIHTVIIYTYKLHTTTTVNLLDSEQLHWGSSGWGLVQGHLSGGNIGGSSTAFYFH